MYARLHITTSVVYRALEQPCRRISLAQWLQQSLAQDWITAKHFWLVCRVHISPVLADLHWLQIRAQITYKIATLVFKIHEVKQPMCLAELIDDYMPVRELRSTSRLLLKELRIKTTIGQRSFHFAAAKIWNGLPDHIRSVDSL